MKKVLIFILLFFWIFWTTFSFNSSIVQYDENSRIELVKQLILAKHNLELTNEWKKNIEKYDKIISRINIEKLTILSEKISKINKTHKLYKKYKSLFTYINAKIWIKMYNGLPTYFNKISTFPDIFNLYYLELYKSRDIKRLFDLQSLKMGIEQFYEDNNEYPSESNFKDIGIYIIDIPKDDKYLQEIWWCKFGYIYEVWANEYWHKNQFFRLSSCLELPEYIKWLLENDWSINNKMLEFSLSIFSGNFKEKFYINSLD